jgi:hypothetical protein
MRRFFTAAAIAALALPLLCVSANAGLLTSHITSAPDTNQLSDLSYETVIQTGLPHPLAKGDIIEGVILYKDIINGNGDFGLGGQPGEVKAIFKIQLTADPVFISAINQYQLSLGPVASDGVMAKIYESTGHELTNAFNTGEATLADYETAATTGTLMATVGFTGAGGAATGGEGWTAFVNMIDGTDSGGSFKANVDFIGAGPGDTSHGLLGDTNTYNFLFSQKSTFGDKSKTQFFLNGTQQNTPPTDKNAPVFPTIDNSHAFFQVQIVPEPSSMALAGIAVVSMGGMTWLRRRKAPALMK